jgi:cytochrome c556
MIRSPSAVAVLLTLGIVLLTLPSRTAARQDDEEERAQKRATEAVLRLSTQLDDKDVAVKAKAIAGDDDLEYVMHVFKPRNRAGLGVGPKEPPLGLPDGIELAIIDLAAARKPRDAAFLKANQDTLLRMAQVTQAVAEITDHYPTPGKPRNRATQARWKAAIGEMKASSKELADAIKATDPIRVRTAATKLNAACNGCHTSYID